MQARPRIINVVAHVLCLLLCAVSCGHAEQVESSLSERFPLLARGGFSFATLGTLPDGILLRSGDIEVSTAELDDKLSKAKPNVRAQLERNRMYLLEQIATRKILLRESRAGKGNPAPDVTEDQELQKFIDSLAVAVFVADEEVSRFYEENEDMWGGASLDQVKDQVRDCLLEQKKQAVLAAHIRTMGQRTPLILASKWVEKQTASALDNPVDKARASGFPTFVDFGATSCRVCARMVSVIEAVRSEYEGELNVLFVHVQEEEILASRYGISLIPTQVFFDKNGKEVFRHTGFFSQDEIEKRLKDMGVE